MFHTKKRMSQGLEKQQKHKTYEKHQNGRHKSYLISNYIECKWSKHPNQKIEIGRIE